MGRGGYNDGSTIINSWGGGWSYDARSATPAAKNKMGKKKAKAKKKNTPTNDNFLEHFSLSCACCELLGIAWPAIKEDVRRALLAGTEANGYQKPFCDKVEHQGKKAKQILRSYTGQCAAADRKGEDRPNVPKSIKFATKVDGFSLRLEAMIKEGKKAYAFCSDGAEFRQNAAENQP